MKKRKISVLVVGDAPNLLSGLARIARDITGLLWQERERLGIEVFQAGIVYDGSPWPWRVFPLHDEANWGKGDWERIERWTGVGGGKGVVFSVWDAARCWELTEAGLGTKLWGYFAVDSKNVNGGFGGPAAEAVQRYDRVLGYGSWGLGVLKEVVQKGKETRWLPHGLEGRLWKGTGWEERGEGRGKILGCVATNQPRKDLGLLFAAAAELRKEKGWEEMKLWLNIDYLVKHWSVPELAEIYGWNSEKLIVTQGLSDYELVQMYGACNVTFAPGLGEGFGYPILESLAAGTPVVHGRFGGGEEWVTREDWLVKGVAERVEGSYGLVRPVFRAEDVAKRLKAAGEEKEKEWKRVKAFCQGAVKNLEWNVLWPRWRSWFESGLEGIRRREEEGKK